MPNYYFLWPDFLCYFAVGFTCFLCSIVDLLRRFKSGNKVTTILLGRYQTFYYCINIAAGCFIFFGADVSETTKISALAHSHFALAVLKSIVFGFAAFISLRVTITNPTASASNEKIEVGPGKFFATLIENIENRIDLERIVTSTDEIKTLLENTYISPRAVFNVMLPYCFDQAEKDPGDRDEITNTLQAIYLGDREICLSERSALMLSHLHKKFGLSVLQIATKLIENETILSHEDSKLLDRAPQSKLKLTDIELDDLLGELKVNLSGKDENVKH